MFVFIYGFVYWFDCSFLFWFPLILFFFFLFVSVSFFVCCYLINVAFTICFGVLSICSFFVCRLIWFFPYFFLSFPFCTVRLVESWCSSKGSGLNLWSGSSDRLWYLNPGCWTTREPLIAWNTNWRELCQRLNTKTWPHLKASKVQCQMPHAKQLAK